MEKTTTCWAVPYLFLTPRDLKIVAQLDAASRLFAQLLTDKGWSEKNALSAHSGDELKLSLVL
jgi:hypothetical protein